MPIKAHTRKQIATWSKAEVKHFEELLNQYGTDLEMIAGALGKSREQVKRKFKILRKHNPNFGFEFG